MGEPSLSCDTSFIEPRIPSSTPSSRRIAGVALLVGGVFFAIVAAIRLTGRPGAAVSSGETSSRPLTASGVRGAMLMREGALGRSIPKLRTNAANPKYPTAALDKFRDNMSAPEPLHSKAFFDAEARNPLWAARMEQELRGRFSEEALKAAGLNDLRLDQIECRTSGCQLELSWGHGSLDHVATRPGADALVGGNPVAYFKAVSGAFGKWTERIPLFPGDIAVPGMRMVRLRSDGRFATREMVLFGPDDIDPDNYRHWVEESRARLLRNRPEAAAL